MWTTYAAAAAVDREAELRKAERRKKDKKKGDPEVVLKSGYGEQGVFGEDEAREVATKLSSEVAREAMRAANASRDEESSFEGSERGEEGRRRGGGGAGGMVEVGGGKAVMGVVVPEDPTVVAERRIEEYRRKAWRRGGRGGKHRPRDEFDELKRMMATVDQKIIMIEANLETILTSDALQRHVPQS
ncbi:hypothetical protein HDU67_004881, partial [Dinochytrium kinnereticum]